MNQLSMIMKGEEVYLFKARRRRLQQFALATQSKQFLVDLCYVNVFFLFLFHKYLFVWPKNATLPIYTCVCRFQNIFVLVLPSSIYSLYVCVCNPPQTPPSLPPPTETPLLLHHSPLPLPPSLPQTTSTAAPGPPPLPQADIPARPA